MDMEILNLIIMEVVLYFLEKIVILIDYLATSKTCNYSSKDCDFHDASYIIDFMNLVGFKSFGEVYGLALPDPNLN